MATPTAAPAPDKARPNRRARRASRALTRNPHTIERKRLAAERAGAVLASGGLLRLPEVLALVPVSPSTFWAGVRTGRFPAGVKIGTRCTAWRAADVRALLDRLGAAAEVQA